MNCLRFGMGLVNVLELLSNKFSNQESPENSSDAQMEYLADVMMTICAATVIELYENGLSKPMNWYDNFKTVIQDATLGFCAKLGFDIRVVGNVSRLINSLGYLVELVNSNAADVKADEKSNTSSEAQTEKKSDNQVSDAADAKSSSADVVVADPRESIKKLLKDLELAEARRRKNKGENVEEFKANLEKIRNLLKDQQEFDFF